MQRIQPMHAPVGFNFIGTPRRMIAVALVGLFHIAVIYALVTGLATRMVAHIPDVLHTTILPPRKETVTPPVPPPAKPNLVKPTLPQIPKPEIRIRMPAAPPSHTITAIAVPHPVAPAAVPPALPPAPAAPSPVAGTHTTPPYPVMARRLGQEGTVRLRIAVAASGAIAAVDVARSSGNSLLDETAAQWVKAHWRYHAATRAGKPVAATTCAEVKFDLKQAAGRFF
ncbi:MAG TPA: energy transducer TonB [Rhizomicrobium sp.]|nr:energy transducer TonB [Rhizomicrobium sp.]